MLEISTSSVITVVLATILLFALILYLSASK